MSTALISTLGNLVWLEKHADAIIAAFPETWTHTANLQPLKLGFDLKLAGVDWRSIGELVTCMVFFERLGMLKRDGMLIRRGNLKVV